MQFVATRSLCLKPGGLPTSVCLWACPCRSALGAGFWVVTRPTLPAILVGTAARAPGPVLLIHIPEHAPEIGIRTILPLRTARTEIRMCIYDSILQGSSPFGSLLILLAEELCQSGTDGLTSALLDE